MSEQDNVAALEGGYKAFGAGDLDAVFGLMAEDTEWVMPGNSAVSGTYRGKEEVGGFFMKLAEKGFTTEPEAFFAHGDQVVTLTKVTAGGRTAREADVWTMRDGKVTHLYGVADTAMLEEVWGRK
jgi:ketosteroid isomerase-like protein